MSRLDQSLIRHPHILSSWLMIRLERSGQKFVLQVVSDLTLDALDPIHDEPAVSDLLRTVRAYMEQRPIVDSAEINQVAAA
jgi:hypothetical protein